jgi:hypothetical protein
MCSATEMSDGHGAVYFKDCKSTIKLDSLCISDCKGASAGILVQNQEKDTTVSRVSIFNNKRCVSDYIIHVSSPMKNGTLSWINITNNICTHAMFLSLSYSNITHSSIMDNFGIFFGNGEISYIKESVFFNSLEKIPLFKLAQLNVFFVNCCNDIFNISKFTTSILKFINCAFSFEEGEVTNALFINCSFRDVYTSHTISFENNLDCNVRYEYAEKISISENNDQHFENYEMAAISIHDAVFSNITHAGRGGGFFIFANEMYNISRLCFTDCLAYYYSSFSQKSSTSNPHNQISLVSIDDSGISVGYSDSTLTLEYKHISQFNVSHINGNLHSVSTNTGFANLSYSNFYRCHAYILARCAMVSVFYVVR